MKTKRALKTSSKNLLLRFIKEGISNFIASLKTSFWMVPAILVVAAIVLAFTSVELDHYYFQDSSNDVFWLFGGKPSAARALLSAIAGSLITVISIAFSVTLVAIQQAASQYSPRVLTRYTKDRGNQIVLGTFMATFVYTLLVLRDVRSPGEDGSTERFVPALSITIALFLTLFSISLLVYFFHHITQLIQVSAILRGIREELDESIDRMYPEPFQKDQIDIRRYCELIPDKEEMPAICETQIRIDEEGYIRNLDIHQLICISEELSCRYIWVPRAVGEYVLDGNIVLKVWTTHEITEDIREKLKGTFTIGPRRTIDQDPLFGIKQINDVALKALSPSVNDATTAEQCLMELSGFISKLIGKNIPSARIQKAQVVFLVNRPGLEDYLEACFDAIRRNAKGNFKVLQFMICIFQNLVEVAPFDISRKAILTQLVLMRDFISYSALDDEEKNLLIKSVVSILDKQTAILNERHDEAA